MQLANQLLSTEALSSLVNHAATTGGGGAGGGGHSSNVRKARTVLSIVRKVWRMGGCNFFLQFIQQLYGIV